MTCPVCGTKIKKDNPMKKWACSACNWGNNWGKKKNNDQNDERNRR